MFLSSANVFDSFRHYPSYEYYKTLSESIYGHFKIKIENQLMNLPIGKFIIIRLPMIFGINSPRTQDIDKAIIENKAIALGFNQIENEFPLAAVYFRKNEEFLRGREKGRFNNEEEWFLFSRKQGINGVEFPKIMTKEI